MRTSAGSTAATAGQPEAAAVPDPGPARPVPPAGPPRPAGNLPESVTSFVGRRRELAAAKARMAESRLVTLLGVGGVGKTRLALRVAADSRRAFRDGVWLVDLAPVRDGSRLAQVVLSSLLVRDQSARNADDTLTDHLRDRRLLIVLDNCEHLSRACAVLVDAMLRAAPGLRVLATSREPLGIDGEHVLTVPPLSAPDADRPGRRPRPVESLAQYEAVHLLVDRARGVRPDFAVTVENHHAVAQLCAWLDGVPLAIELAATRLRSLSVAEVVARLDDRFGFLTGGSRAAQPRQQTLRAMIDWSYELCTREEQLLWARLSVFAGSFDLAAAEGVGGGADLRADTVVDLVDHLVAKSVVVAERRGERVRYRMLMTVREYGAELLDRAGERELLGRRHRDHYLARAQAMAADWCGPGQAEALARMREDHADLRAALQWSLEYCPNRPEEARTAAEFVAALRYHWVVGGFLGEGRRWLDQVLDTVDEACPERGEALWVASWVCLVQGDGPAATDRLAECGALAETLGDDLLGAHAAHWSGLAAMFRGEAGGSVPLFERAVTGFERFGNPAAVLTAQFQFAIALTQHGDLVRARQVCEEASGLADRHGERWARTYLRWAGGIIRWHEGELAAAQELVRHGLTTQRDFHDGICVALLVELTAWIAARRRAYERAAHLLGAARAVWSEIGTAMHSFGPGLDVESVRSAEAAERALGPRRFAALLAEGGTVDLPGAIEVALRETDDRAPSGGVSRAGSRPTAGEPASPLSRREGEVAELIAQGLSNRVIAESLVLSVRTVDGHVERILAKLGFGSRAQVAAWVADHTG